MTASDEPPDAGPGEPADATSRREVVLDRILRFGLTTVADVSAHVCPDITAASTRKWLDRLATDGWLGCFPLLGRENYFVAGVRAARARGLPDRKARPLGPQAKTTAYGTLLYCTRRPVRKPTAAEFRAEFPDLCRERTGEAHYFVERTPPFRLGLLLIDHGADARRLPAKALKVVRARDRLPAFCELMTAEGFTIAVVCPSAGRAAQLRRAFRRKPCRTAEVTVEVVPELLPLLAAGG